MDQERSELCNTDMSSFLPPPYNNISNMVCRPVWNTFLLRYQKKEDNVVTFILSAVYTTGWVAMGFSKDGRMVGSSAMVGWFNRKGQARIKEYYLQGELDLTKVPPAVVINGAMIYLAFQAKFEKPLASQPIILAFGTRFPNHFRLSSHDDKTTILFDFTAGSASRAHIHPGQMKKNHGVLGTLAWGLFLPVGAIVARYLKHKDPLWYYLHAGVQFFGFLLGLANVVLGQQLYNKIDANIPSHRGIGIFALTLSILQVCPRLILCAGAFHDNHMKCILINAPPGIQILAFFLRPKKDAKIRKYWNWYHHWFGRIALFFGVFNIVWGIHLGAAGMSWKIGFGFLITMILVTVIILETLSWLRGSERTTTPPETFQMNPF
ncbi:cytochrome b561 and DOMON domain-containing protein [Salix suchowensis]|nr:cytochrome b561 and DOMON domain-containing protein [Salix suchowensis]